MITLQEAINKRKQELESITIDTTDIDFLNTFTPDIASLCKNDYIDIIILLYMVRMDVNLDDTLEELENIAPFLSELEDLDVTSILILLEIFKEVNEKYKKELKNKTMKDYLSLKIKDEMVQDLKKMIKDLRKHYSEEIVDGYLKWMSDETLTNIIEIAAKLKAIESNIYSIFDEFEDIETTSRKKKKKKIKSINNLTDSYIKLKTEEFKDVLSEIKIYIERKTKEVSNKKREINKQLKQLADLEKNLLNNSLTVENITKLDLGQEIINLALIEIIKRKNIEFTENYNTLTSFNQNPINKLEIIFNTFGYNLNLLTEEEQELLSKAYNEDKIKENLSFIKTSSLSFIKENDEGFVKIITLDSTLLMQLDSLLMRGKINKEFILKHFNKLNQLTVSLLIHNINKLDSVKVDFNLLASYDDNLLFNLNAELFDLIVRYNIDLKCENLKHFEFLENPKLIEIIDKFIELGLLKQIQSLPNLITSYSNTIIKRIILMQQLEMECLNERDTLNQTARNGKDFYLSDNELNEYTYENFVIYMNPEIFDILSTSNNLDTLEFLPEEISYIEKYKKNEQSYIINGVYFSRIKVLRCLKTLIDAGFQDYSEVLFNALIYNHPKHISIETIEELRTLNQNISKKELISNKNRY